MEQNIISLGFNVAEFTAEQKIVYEASLKIYQLLKEMDGFKIGIGGSGTGWAELKAHADGLQIKLNELQVANLQLTQSILEGKKAAQESAKATKEKAAADKDAAKAAKEASDYERELEKQRKLGLSTAAAEAKITAQLCDEYGLLNKALKDQELRYKNLALVHGIESKAAKDALKTALETRAVLDRLDGNLRNHQRNVGNYKSAFDGLGMSFSQVARELPSLTISTQQFFLAISNNLPLVFDEIRKVKQEIAALQAQGEKTQSLTQRIVKSLFSWNMALNAIILLLTVFGGHIVSGIQSLFGYNDALENTAKATERLQKAQLELIRNMKELEKLYDTPISDVDRLDKELQIAQALGKSKLETLAIEKRIASERAAIANDRFFEVQKDNSMSGFAALEDYKKKLLVADINYTMLVVKQSNIQDEDEAKKLDKKISRAKVELDLYKEKTQNQQKAVNDYYKANAALEVKDAEIIAEENKKAKASKDLADKTAEEILKIKYEMAKRDIQRQIDEAKEVVDNDKERYRLRLQALGDYNAAKIAMIELDRKYEIDSENLKYEEIKKNLNKQAADDRNKEGGPDAKLQTQINSQLEKEKAAHLLRLVNLESKYYDELRRQGKAYLADIKKLDEDREKNAKDAFKIDIDRQAENIKAKRSMLDAFQEEQRRKRLKDLERQQEEQKLLLDFTKDFANKAVDFVQTLIDAGYTRQQNAIEKLIDANNDYEAAELNRIQNSTVSEQEKAAMVIQLNAQVAAKNKQLEDEQKQIRIKQAEFDKAMAIAKITLNTAIAATNAMITGDPYTAALRAGIVIALGAAELAIAIATPIPTYAEGTDNHPGGYAITGEGKHAELVSEPGKKPYVVDKATLSNLPAGTKVKPLTGDYINEAMYGSMLTSQIERLLIINALENKRSDTKLSEIKDAIIEQGWHTQQAIKNQKRGNVNIHLNGNFGEYLQNKVIN